MTIQLARFIMDCPGFFVTSKQIGRLIEIDRLALLLVRCGGCRFMAPAQDVPVLCHYVTQAGDYIRDVSFPAQMCDDARALCTSAALAAGSLTLPAGNPRN